MPGSLKNIFECYMQLKEIIKLNEAKVLLVTSHQSLVASHQALVNSHQSLVTKCQLLLTSYQLTLAISFQLIMFLVRTIFANDIRQKCLLVSRRVTRGGMGGGPPCPFSKVRKSALMLGRKCPDFGHLLVNFSFKKQFLRAFRRNIRRFPCGTFLSRVVDGCLSKCPNSKKTPLP